ncbi:chlorohydrolase [Streptococcus pneumoniae]|nr:chlorohydrolase [Streptococcus pneumoniae]
MKIKEQARKLAVGCSKHYFEVVDKTDKVSKSINCESGAVVPDYSY